MDISQLSERPISTIRIDDYSFMHDSYGKKVPEAGKWCIYQFSIYILDDAYPELESETSKFYKVMDDAEEIITYLIQKDQDTTENSIYNIVSIYDLTLEQSQQRKARNLGRMIITGKIKTKWTDV